MRILHLFRGQRNILMWIPSAWQWDCLRWQLLKMAGCVMDERTGHDGTTPLCDENGATSVPGIYAVGDVSGIEEASSAMIEGRIAGLAAAAYLGFMDEKKCREAISCQKKALMSLRRGMFAPQNKGRKLMTTEEGIPLSEHLLKEGYVGDEEIGRFPGSAPLCRHSSGDGMYTEYSMQSLSGRLSAPLYSGGDDITALPAGGRHKEMRWLRSLVWLPVPGRPSFFWRRITRLGFAAVTIPYEFIPLPEKGEKGTGLGRKRGKICS